MNQSSKSQKIVDRPQSCIYIHPFLTLLPSYLTVSDQVDIFQWLVYYVVRDRAQSSLDLGLEKNNTGRRELRN